MINKGDIKKQFVSVCVCLCVRLCLCVCSFIFYCTYPQVPKVHREFSMGVASVADSTGIMVAAFLAQALHYFICSRYIGFKPSSSFI